MAELLIDRIEIQIIEPETERFIWSEGMPSQFMSNTVVRVFTRDGIEGVAGGSSCTDFGFDRAVAESAKLIAPGYIGASVHDRVRLWHSNRKLNVPSSQIAHAVIDVALWDAAAKAAGMPLHKLLGSSRSQIPSYASTPLYASQEAYLDEVARLSEEGFQAFKFHCWCNPDRDLPMCEAVATTFSSKGLQFMLDVEQRYDRHQARRAAQVLSDLNFLWFEAPILDYDLTGAAELRRHSEIDIVPAGNWLTDRHQVVQGIEASAWDRVRIDVLTCGGLTPALDIASLAASHAMPLELQCWGYTLSQAANLHLMLAAPTATYFEQPVPYAAFEYGSHSVIRTDREGMVAAPDGAGLGVEVDWSAMERANGARFDIRG